MVLRVTLIVRHRSKGDPITKPVWNRKRIGTHHDASASRVRNRSFKLRVSPKSEPISEKLIPTLF
jgi:hypothetical protein